MGLRVLQDNVMKRRSEDVQAQKCERWVMGFFGLRAYLAKAFCMLLSATHFQQNFEMMGP